jgi:hypothetical protein
LQSKRRIILPGRSRRSKKGKSKQLLLYIDGRAKGNLEKNERSNPVNILEAKKFARHICLTNLKDTSIIILRDGGNVSKKQK